MAFEMDGGLREEREGSDLERQDALIEQQAIMRPAWKARKTSRALSAMLLRAAKKISRAT